MQSNPKRLRFLHISKFDRSINKVPDKRWIIFGLRRNLKRFLRRKIVKRQVRWFYGENRRSANISTPCSSSSRFISKRFLEAALRLHFTRDYVTGCPIYSWRSVVIDSGRHVCSYNLLRSCRMAFHVFLATSLGQYVQLLITFSHCGTLPSSSSISSSKIESFYKLCSFQRTYLSNICLPQ